MTKRDQTTCSVSSMGPHEAHATGYAAGRTEERRRIVAWLRAKLHSDLRRTSDVLAAARMIEQGRHEIML